MFRRVPLSIIRRLSLNTLTYSMVQSRSWEANWFAASHEIPRIWRNPKVHYRTHKRPPPVSILDQPNPVHIPTSHLLEICPNIIHPTTPRSPHWSPSLRFPQQDPTHWTHSNDICHTGLLTACEQNQDIRSDPACKLPENLYDIFHCCVYSEKLLIMDRGIV